MGRPNVHYYAGSYDECSKIEGAMDEFFGKYTISSTCGVVVSSAEDETLIVRPSSGKIHGLDTGEESETPLAELESISFSEGSSAFLRLGNHKFRIDFDNPFFKDF